MSKKFVLTTFVGFCMILTLAMGVSTPFRAAAASLAQEEVTPTITSDAPDYPAGATVMLTGTGWASGEAVHIVVNDTIGQTWQYTADVNADDSGGFTNSFNLPTYFVSDYDVTATGPISGTATTTFTDAPPQANLDQCRNGSAASPNDCLNLGGNTGWVNGNVGASQSHMLEGYSTPFRTVMTNLPTNTTITLVIGYDIRNSGANAYDYLTQYQNLDPHTYFGHPAETVYPTDGVTGLSTTTTTFPIPAPSSAGSPVPGQPTANFNSLPAAKRVMTLFGGTISGVAYVNEGSLTANQSETQVAVTFKVDNPTAVLAWGGHIAQCSVWGTDANGKCISAGGISGSPYHMRLVSWTDYPANPKDELPNLGNTDKSMAAAVVVQPGNLTLAKSLTGGPAGYTGPFTINYSCTDGTSGSVTINAGSSQTINGIPSGSVCTISEPTLPTPPLGYSFGTPTFSPSNTVTIGAGTTVTVTTNNTLTFTAKDLTVSKTVTASFNRTYTWDISKSVDNTKVFTAGGAPATFNYTVSITHDSGTASDWKVTGSITVSNPNSFSVSGVSVTDAIDPNATCSVSGGSSTIAANSSATFNYTCTYSAAPAASSQTNTATATWTDFGTGNTSASGTASVDWSSVTPTIKDGSVSVTDTLGGSLGTVSYTDPSPTTFTYSKTFTDPAGTCTDHKNTATFTTNTSGTTGSASQTVTDCQGADLTITKTATPAFTRTYLWGISKSVDDANVFTAGGASHTFNYTVDVTHDSGTDSAWQVTGKITVSNPNDWEDIVADVSDALDTGSCTVTGGTNVTIPKSDSVTLDYTCDPASASATKNTATATWDKAFYHTPNGSASGSASFAFTTPTIIVDGSVSVSDPSAPNPPFPATVSYTDSSPTTFKYSETFTDPAGTCTDHKNTATFTTSDSGKTGSSSVTVTDCQGADLTVSKTATPAFTRTYLWEIFKNVDKTHVTQVSGNVTFNYTVQVNQTGFTDSAWKVTGQITVSNPNDWEAVTVDLTDAVDNGGSCVVTNGTGVSVPASGSVSRNYTCTFSSGASGTNTVIAKWDKATYHTPNGSASGSASFAFTTPTTTVNKTITVTDTFMGATQTLGTVTATDAAPFASKTFTYSYDVPVPDAACKSYTNTAKIVETGQSASQTVTVCKPSLVTDTMYCTLTNSQFKLIFTPDNGSQYWKLNASNPGQFYYNIFYSGPGDVDITVTLPYPFVTQGAVPIHAYSDVSFYTNNLGQLCLTPGTLLPNPPQTFVTLSSYSPQQFGSNTTVIVHVPSTGSSGFAYLNIHLDYGLKGTTGWSKGSINQAISYLSTPLPTIYDPTTYNFSDTSGGTGTIASTNSFKKDPGIGGLVLNGNGDPKANVQVKIYSGSTVNAKNLLATVSTDEDGWYMWQYKYTGKPATFTVSLPAYNLTQTVTLKANGFLVVSFTVP